MERKNSTTSQSSDKEQLQNYSINMAIIKFLVITVLTVLAINNSARAALPFFVHNPGASSFGNEDDFITSPISLQHDICMNGQHYGAYAVSKQFLNVSCTIGQ